LKKRDAACGLDSKESNRDRWMQDILKDDKKTVCVVRFTRARVGQLEQTLADAGNPSARQAPAEVLEDNDRYEIYSSNHHNKGKWYFEVLLDVGEIAKNAETALSIGFENPESHTGNLINIRRRDTNRPIERLGFAIDLDSGKYYSSYNGGWQSGSPGSAQGLDIKLGRDYRARVVSSVAMGTLLDKKLIQINFGGKPFAYPMPPGYRPFSEH